MKQSTVIHKPFLQGSAEEVADSLTSRYAPVKIEPYEKHGLVKVYGTYGNLGGLEYNMSQYELGLHVVPLQYDEAHFFVFPDSSICEFFQGSSTTVSREGQAISGDSEKVEKAFYPSGHAHVAVSLKKKVCQQRADSLFGRSSRKSIVFEPLVDLEDSPVRQVKLLIRHLVVSGLGETLTEAPFAARHMLNTIVDLLIELWPNNLTPLFENQPATIAPRHVRFAVDFLQSNLELMTTDEELAKLCGVSLRSLQFAFRAFLGTSISRYERDLRLERARNDLTGGEMTVQEVARKWGFSNTDRFSTLFEVKFGFRPIRYRM